MNIEILQKIKSKSTYKELHISKKLKISFFFILL